jgi:nitroreductase
MNVADALMTRRTIRAFKPGPVGREQIMKVIAPALHAPSWANSQPWEVFVAAGEPLERIRKGYGEMLAKGVPRSPDVAMPAAWPDACRVRMETLKSERSAAMAEACPDPKLIPDLMTMNYRLFEAPVVVSLCMDRSLAPWSLFDLGALSHSILLSATEQGLGSAVAITLAAHPDIIRKELGVPDGLAVVIGIALGVPDLDSPQNAYRSSRRPAEEVVHWGGL